MSTVTREANGQVAAPPRYYPEASYDYAPEKAAGWLMFSGIVLGFAGLFGFIDGLVAISKSSFYVAGAHYVFSDLNTWGWIVMLVGVLAMFAAFGVVARAQWARWTGITIAGLQAMAQLLMIQAYPWWSLCIFALDILVIYGLAAYGGRRADLDA